MFRRVATPLISRLFSSAQQHGSILHEGVELYGPYVAEVEPEIANRNLRHLSLPPDSQGLFHTPNLSSKPFDLHRALDASDLGRRVFFYTPCKPGEMNGTVSWNANDLPNRQLKIVPVVITDGVTYETPTPALVSHFGEWLSSVMSSAPKFTKDALGDIAAKLQEIAEAVYKPSGPKNK